VLDTYVRLFCRSRFLKAGILWVTVVFLSAGHYSSGLQLHPVSIDGIQASLDAVLSRMMEHRQWQQNALREYQASRLFRASNPRLSPSTLEVRTIFRWPDSLQSTVLRYEGSAFIREHVFEKILQAEADLAAQSQADIIPKNYDFALVGKEDCQGRPCWRLAIKPKRKDKYLINGDIWLDGADYAMSRVHGSPSQHVSIWVSRVDIDERFSPIDGVWLANKLESSSSIRLVGDFLLQVEYRYEAVKVASVGTSGHFSAHSN
jgi:hypothetical protein